MDSNTSFIPVNIPAFVKKHMDGIKETVTNGMTESEIKAYDLAITNCLLAIESMLGMASDNEVIVYEEGLSDEELEIIFQPSV